MHRTRSSTGFSLDIPLIMLTASILKVFYWPGARFDLSLLIQALVMIVVQTLLLKVALDNRAIPLRPEAFEMKLSSKSGSGASSTADHIPLTPPAWAPRREKPSGRPWNFWRWGNQAPYWQYVVTLACALAVIHVLVRPARGRAEDYTTLLGAIGLGIEALLPIPQLWQNWQSQSCRGFRLSVLVNWLFGDTMKMGFFFLSEPGMIPWSFKACGIFQALCDLGLGLQYWIYGEGLDYDIDGHFA